MEEFKVTINQFDGPLDLMLHLIKEKELDLLDLDINALTDQYIAYLESMETLHLEIAGEYLVEMATLIEYKSRRMLPSKKDEIDEIEEDPQKALVQRLLEYQRYKEATQELSEMYNARQLRMGKPLSVEADEWMKTDDSSAKFKGNPYMLMKAMQRCLMRSRLGALVETKYTAKELSMEDRELVVRARLFDLPDTFPFKTLLEDCTDIQMAIVTFLAVLDLARQHILYFTVDENENIWFSKGGLVQ